MPRIFNFSPGPATLPEAVLQQAADEMLDWQARGMSIMEMSHRGKDFMPLQAQAESDLRELMGIPGNYKVLFLQGGACGQNAFIPMNLLGSYGTADYVDTGEWSQRSISEAQRYGKVNVAASAKDNGYTAIPQQNAWQLDAKAAYVHVCCNETIGGLEYHWTPDTGSVPLVGDMSSNILSREMDVTRYGLIYAGAQKNIGPAGLTIVIVRDDLLDRALPITPSVFTYKTQAENNSMLNTPPTFAIYMAGLMFQWIKSQGGVSVMETRNRAKAALLYDYIDASSFYENRIAKDDRSLVNVPFHLRDDSLNEAFLQGALEQGLAQLKGHRIVGGMRASIYNAMPMEGVQALVAYMREFERLRG